MRFGRVSSFDARRGWGTVTDADGTEFEFHATAIVDGSRRIDPETSVVFEVVPGHRGRYEARGLTALSGGSATTVAPGSGPSPASPHEPS
jgi:cold shock CspA family protein